MTFNIRRGHCIDQLRLLRDESVHCAITSPPYFGLRSYLQDDNPTKPLEIGVEKTLQEHIARLVDVFREVRRVLRKDGTCWINYGDAYAYDGKRGGEPGGKEAYRLDVATRVRKGRENRTTGLKPKDRMLLPARLAIALCDDGWWVRDEIIFHKRNPMPTSVQDRTTPAHEMIYMFSKSAHYFYDGFAIRELASSNTNARTGKIKAPDGWDTGPGGHGTFHRNGREKGKTVERLPDVTPKSAPEDSLIRAKESWHASTVDVLTTRNKRSVWSIATEPSADDSKHYAAFPTALVLPMIRAGTSEKGCCACCGAPWQRNMAKGDVQRARRCTTSNASHVPDARPHTAMRERGYPRNGHVIATTGWSPGCACDAPIVPCTVLDCFLGSGTTALVADRLGRHCIGIELNEEYAAYAERRVREDAGQLFAAIEEAAMAEQKGLFDEAAE